ncbi:MAG: carboxypeptidase regulatory-like domain-containing protein, partial [Lachnospiraceae bacterium]|nr:carboxypeptidase regulatory-like domain-containing protein [Lachnospiraceae bacterium]
MTSYSYVMLTTGESQQAASLKGVVISATDSQNVEGATVAFLKGFDKTSNGNQDVIDSSTHTTTGSDGTFSIEDGVNAGYYTVEVSKDGYSTYHRNETVKPGENEFAINMSPAIETQGTYRIVLTWGSSPRDLDSHLICTGNENYHVYYGDKVSYDNKASLDWDDTTSYGPETITVEIGQGNSYIYAVHNFTDRNATAGEGQAWNLANSGAKVEVYDSSGIIFDGNVPVGVQGTTWEVFRIENGRLIVTNNVGFDHPGNLVNDDVSTVSADETADLPLKSGLSEDNAVADGAGIVDEAKNIEASEAEATESQGVTETQTEETEETETEVGEE